MKQYLILKQKSTRDKIMDHFQNYSQNTERINLKQVWKTMNKFWPKVSKLPAAKKNRKGRLISEPKALKKSISQRI